MGQTVVEKIISNHAGKTVHQEDMVVVPVDGAMASDTTAPLTIKAFKAMGGRKLWNPEKCTLVVDHAAPAPNERIANMHMMMREFAAKQGCRLFEAGEGICHQLLIEKNIISPGDLFVGADSHTCSAGAVGALGIGVGSTDLAAVWLTGKIWLKVPKTIRIELLNRVHKGVQSKDLMLAVLGKTGIAGATYQAMEFCGEAVKAMSLSSRIVMANMMIEAGAKTGYIQLEGMDLPERFLPICPDHDAEYEQTITIDAARIRPMVSRPHSPADTCPVDDVAGQTIQYAFIGTCANGRLEDLRTAAKILKGSKVAPGTRLVVGPASRKIFLEAVADGTLETLVSSGATVIPPGCGPCVGTHNGVPGDGE